MKKILFTVLVVSSFAHAGFWGSMAGGAIGSSMGSGSSTTTYQPTMVETRMDKLNTYLWNMHKTGKYTKNYKFYLNYLEKSDAIGDLDTVAWVYKDNGNKKKAIQIYKTRILPWVKIEEVKIQTKYKRFFQEISDQIVATPKRKGTTSKQECENKGKNWVWNSNSNRWMCVK